MFGHVQINPANLTENEIKRYRSLYCGLCRSIKQRHGQLARLSLSNDLTFLAMLLTSLYEPKEGSCDQRCLIHPLRDCVSVENSCLDYAADMTIVLTYYKCMDDWQDEKKLVCLVYAKSLEKSCKEVKERWPRQCNTIEKELNTLSEIEKNGFLGDAAANCFGRLMEELFVYQKDYWEESLRSIGRGLGRFIYYADAAIDYDKDLKKKQYNPLNDISSKPEELRPMLMMLLGETSEAFEYLPLEKDVGILRNILYSGIWIHYNQGMEQRRKKRGQ